MKKPKFPANTNIGKPAPKEPEPVEESHQPPAEPEPKPAPEVPPKWIKHEFQITIEPQPLSWTIELTKTKIRVVNWDGRVLNEWDYNWEKLE